MQLCMHAYMCVCVCVCNTEAYPRPDERIFTEVIAPLETASTRAVNPSPTPLSSRAVIRSPIAQPAVAVLSLMLDMCPLPAPTHAHAHAHAHARTHRHIHTHTDTRTHTYTHGYYIPYTAASCGNFEFDARYVPTHTFSLTHKHTLTHKTLNDIHIHTADTPNVRAIAVGAGTHAVTRMAVGGFHGSCCPVVSYLEI